MRVAPLLVLVGLSACKPAERAPGPAVATESAQADTAVTEAPVWSFGEGSARTDSLPADLDSLAAWGEYYDGARPVAYSIDLNGDGRAEWLVRGAQSVCGRGGCPVKLITRTSDGRLIDLLDGLVRYVHVTNRRANGWPVLWVSTGGRNGGVFRMEFRENGYQAAGTLRETKETEEWTNEQLQNDSILKRINAAPIP